MMASLCETCRNMREIHTARSRFLLCELSNTNGAYPKYPPQPIPRCDGYTTTNSWQMTEGVAMTSFFTDQHDGDWRQRLGVIVDMMRQLSLQTDPQEMVR